MKTKNKENAEVKSNKKEEEVSETEQGKKHDKFV